MNLNDYTLNNARLPETNIAAAAILNLEKLMLFLHFLTKFNETR